MSVKYKSSDGWKDISSSSNNAVDTVAEDNMGAVTSNAVWEWSRYENAVRLNFYAEGTTVASGQGIKIPSTYDTADKQAEYMLNYVRDISIAKDKPLVYCGNVQFLNASNTTSVICSINTYTFQIATTKSATNYWARGLFANTSGNATYSSAVAGISQTGSFWALRQCETAVGDDTVAINFSVTSTSSSATYTAPADGIVKAHVTNLTGGDDAFLVVNGVNVDHCPFWRAGAITMSAPVAKGDTYYVSTNTAPGDSKMFVNSIEFTRVNHWTSRATSW